MMDQIATTFFCWIKLSIDAKINYRLILANNDKIRESIGMIKKHDLFNELKENYARLTGSQKKIGKYILDHYERVAFMSAVELANAVGVSDATIIRFTRNIGFSGYVEFKQYMREGMKAFDGPDNRMSKSLELLQEEEDLTKRVGQIDIDNLTGFVNGLDQQLLDEAVAAIYQAKRIYLAGRGTASIIVQFLHLHLQRMGFSAISISEGITVSPEKLIGITEEDLLISCGFPRYSKDTYNAVLFAKNKKATVLTITDSDLSVLAVKSDIVLTAKLDNITFFHSYIVPMALCNVLLMKVFEKNGENLYGTVSKNMESLKIFDMTV